MARNVLAHAALLGAAAGARSATPLAALAQQQRNVWTRSLSAAAALGEIIVDKLPRTPSRLRPAPLAGRVVLGALAGAAYARRHDVGILAPALTAAAAAGAASYAGAAWRGYASRHNLGLPGALAEDAAAIALASAAARR